MIVAALLLSSCNKWLDVTPPSQVREDIQFSTVEGFQQALIGCYIAMTDDLLYGRALSWGTIELLGGQYRPLEPYSSNDYYVSNYNWSSANGLTYVKGVWERAYNVIASANNALKFTEQKREVLDNINYKLIKGELLAIRAFIHFDLLRLYGYGNLEERRELLTKATVPYVVDMSKEMTPQRTYGATIQAIISDLEEAIELLEIDPVTQSRESSYYEAVNIDGFYNKRENRLNYYATLQLLARVHLWEGSSEGITKALSLSQQIIDEAESKGLVSWISSSTVSDDMIMRGEHLFSLNTSNLFAKSADYFKIEIKSAGDIKAQYLTADQVDQIYETSTVGSNDFRFTSQLIQNSMIINGRNSFTPLKYYGSSTDRSSTNYIPLIRLPEAYYIAAECNIKKSTPNLTKAMELLNIVRQKRGITEDIEGATAELLMEEIVKEYHKEYIAEGQMYLLYKRLGAEIIPGYTGSIDDQVYTLPYPPVEIQMGRVQ